MAHVHKYFVVSLKYKLKIQSLFAKMPVLVMNAQQRKYNPLQKKMNAEEESLSKEQREALILSEASI